MWKPAFRRCYRIAIRGYLKHTGIDPLLVLANDLHHGVGTIHSHDKEGVIPSIISQKTDSPNSKNAFILQSEADTHRKATTSLLIAKLESDSRYAQFLKPRIQKIRRFVSPEFPLLDKECLAVICGRSVIDLKLQDKNSTSEGIVYSSDKLLALGSTTLEAYMALATLFTDEGYLSLPSDELQPLHEIFCDKQLIPEFMIKNLLYECLIPYRGAMRQGRIYIPEELTVAKKQIMNETAIASFYTLIGILCVKFDQRIVARSLIIPTILHGQRGLIQLATERLTRSHAHKHVHTL